MNLGALALSIALAALQPAPAFAPPLDRPITLTVTESRDLDGVESHFSVERRIIFHRRPDGYTADVETLAGDGDAPNSTGALAEAALAALVGRHVIIDLDSTGKPTAVQDREAIWTLVIDRLAREAARESGKASGEAPELVPLRTLPPARQLDLLGGMIVPLVGTDVATAGVRPSRPITVTLRAPDGIATALSGTERTYREPGGNIVLERQLSGSGGGSTRQVTVSFTRSVDPSTGLIVAMRQSSEVKSGAGVVRQVRTAKAVIG